ncbi:MAG: membrane protein insertion efficiency factor YidD [Limisphaerales bacterium]
MNPAQHILVFAICVYRWTISPAQVFFFGSTGGCRYTPTCSQYAIESIRTHGSVAGSCLALKRICRCHPWGGCGHDPVPPGQFKIKHSKFKTAEFVR